MEDILRCFIKEGNAEMVRQIEFIIKQLNSGPFNARICDLSFFYLSQGLERCMGFLRRLVSVLDFIKEALKEVGRFKRTHQRKFKAR